eukprot:gnl/TRDRNA2_/TRDRNA2_205721_c0_seq1.p1 gnl/TRDRNA2_/TRDRNA2_205721_c0~~gnl/TRDRNA2_/TRDRNA2_205721_c0_seq1.p1  ORF type:complete len:355 (+),score=45.14 gnl/TRDRNA2_/TRDRNA2_205721_c0_seq1:87-1151(+)
MAPCGHVAQALPLERRSISGGRWPHHRAESRPTSGGRCPIPMQKAPGRDAKAASSVDGYDLVISRVISEAPSPTYLKRQSVVDMIEWNSSDSERECDPSGHFDILKEVVVPSFATPDAIRMSQCSEEVNKSRYWEHARLMPVGQCDNGWKMAWQDELARSSAAYVLFTDSYRKKIESKSRNVKECALLWEARMIQERADADADFRVYVLVDDKAGNGPRDLKVLLESGGRHFNVAMWTAFIEEHTKTSRAQRSSTTAMLPSEEQILVALEKASRAVCIQELYALALGMCPSMAKMGENVFKQMSAQLHALVLSGRVTRIETFPHSGADVYMLTSRMPQDPGWKPYMCIPHVHRI